MSAERIARVQGHGLVLRGPDVDTDRIMPARFLRAITFEGLDKHVFEDDRRAARQAGTVHPFDDPRFQEASVLVVNENFGSGSSREHAPQGLRRWGIRAVIGESFAEIFFGNSLMIGLPCVTASATDIEALMACVEKDASVSIAVDLAAGTCHAGDLQFPIAIPAHVRDALMAGAWDTTGLLMDRYDEVTASAARLPYLSGFSAPRPN
jgi:3-isopropylmalate/(R)-2-methylmalate dehydratase small subunit